MGTEYPVFDICNMVTNRLSNDLFNIDRFYGYVKNNPHAQSIHKHSFYPQVLFTAGTGKHLLDFETYPIKERIIYFMRPNQAHKWAFDGEVDGYVINFSPSFFDQLAVGSSILENFLFFNLFSSNQVTELDKESLDRMIQLFEAILNEVEKAGSQKQSTIMIISYLLQIFVITNRCIQDNKLVYNQENYNSLLVKKFIELIEENFREIKLPKGYAAMLYITSNHLNFICQEQAKLRLGS
jgi:AraC family transcriptional activator of pobA